MKPLRIRRLVATVVDPDLSDELADLRDRNVEAHITIQAQRTLLRDLQASHAVEKSIADAMRQSAELEANALRADVARLLEDAARCAHEHSDT